MLVTVILASLGAVSAQIQVPHGPVLTHGSPREPHPADLYGPPNQGAAHAVTHIEQTQSSSGGRRSENIFLASSPLDPFFTNSFSTNAFTNPGFHVAAGYPGFYSGFGLSPQQNGDGSWNFVALPIPLENQTIPEGLPRDQVAQAKLWGPIYKENQGWVYGEAGTILVPKFPPYAPPRYVTPPALQTSSNPSPPPAVEDKGPLAEGTIEVDTKTGKSLVDRPPSSSQRIQRLRSKEPRK